MSGDTVDDQNPAPVGTTPPKKKEEEEEEETKGGDTYTCLFYRCPFKTTQTEDTCMCLTTPF